MNKLLHESREDQWPLPVGVFGENGGKVRLQPSVGAILDAARGDLLGRGDFLITASLRFALIAGIVGGNLRWVYDTIGELIGPRPTDGKSASETSRAGSPTPNGRAA